MSIPYIRAKDNRKYDVNIKVIHIRVDEIKKINDVPTNQSD